MTVRDLTSFRRRFVRAEFGPECLLDGETTQADLDAERDDFMTGIVVAEFAASHGELDCAACGSPDVCRAGPTAAPWTFGVVTSPRTGHAFGYALCRACVVRRKVDAEAVFTAVDAAFREG